jgi:tRNA(Ile)-lysidine synthase
MLQQLLNFVHKQKLFQPGERLLLAVSGGIDSVVLTHLFSRASIRFGIAHCNFHLRGEESDGDEAFVRTLAINYGVPVFIEHFETEAYASRHGISIQMAARDLRRGWFENLLIREEYQKMATAHHLNDSLETAIFNLTKGTGIAGLQGILPASGPYVRPLLFATRDMILQYACDNNIAWREDRSNSSVKYSRNHIRHRVIPELKKINPNLEMTFAETSEKIMAVTALFNEAMASKRDVLMRRKGAGFEIDKEVLSHSAQPCITLHELLAPFGFNYAQAKDIFKAMNRQPGKVFYSDSHQLVNDRRILILNEIGVIEQSEVLVGDDDSKIGFLGSIFVFETLDNENAQIDPGRNLAFIDMGKLQFPLKIRTWRHGDFFFPLGMKHKKKVSDFMIDEKIPVNLKSKLMVIFSGDDLIWVVGYRIDNRYRITEKTSKILKISTIISHD